MKSSALFGLLLSGIFLKQLALGETLKVLPSLNDGSLYCAQLLERALKYSGRKIHVLAATKDASLARQAQDVLNGKLDVVWFGTSRSIEKKLLPIRIPIFKGLLGYRLLIIRNGEQALFNDIYTLRDLQKKVLFGQGKAWADVEVLASNGIGVVTAMEYEHLFNMLNAGRFDAFPRGLHEPWSEVSSRPKLGLAIEEKLIVVYKMPLYFFVSPKNTELATDLENGLLAMVEDGSFDRFFFSHPVVKNALAKSNLANRRVISLDNPHLPEETPTDNPAFWFDPRTHSQ